MVIYFYKHNGIDYIFHKSEQNHPILATIAGNTNIVNDSMIELGKFYNRETLVEIDDETEILNAIKGLSYLKIKAKVYSTTLINTCLAKWNYTSQLYFNIMQNNDVEDTIDGLYAKLKSEELNIGEPGEIFIIYYEMSQNIKTKIVDVLENFDNVYFNDESTLSDLMTAIFTMNDLYKLDPFTFLKEQIYS